MRSSFALAVVVSALPFSILAAQSRFTAPPAQNQQNQQNQQIRWANMDANDDGVITRAEWRGTGQAFEDADWNADGILSGDEVRPNAQRNTARTTNDAAAQQRAARFQTLDSDKDGFIARWEWPETWQAFTALDQNGDDVLSRAEMVSTRAAAPADTSVGTSGQAGRRGVGTSGNIVRVDPKQRWTDTGLDIVAGDRVSFDAEGNLQLSEGPPDNSTPNGAGRRAANAPLPRANAGALIARIGDSAPLLIGDRRNIGRAPVSGRLYLGVNDDHLDDNSGEYRVSITIQNRD